MELEVYKINGQQADRKVSLSDSIFGIEPNDHAIYLDVKRYLANKRQGTHSTKNRAVITGSTRKIKRQKGTGTARAGDIKSPIFRGGGIVFGPQPKDHTIKLNKKLTKLARRSALTYKAKADEIIILEDFSIEEPKTKNYVEVLDNLKIKDAKTLLVMPNSDRNILLASRNVKNTKVLLADNINTYEILNANKIVISESSLEKIEAILKKD